MKMMWLRLFTPKVFGGGGGGPGGVGGVPPVVPVVVPVVPPELELDEPQAATKMVTIVTMKMYCRALK
jgi:hypothetical protein